MSNPISVPKRGQVMQNAIVVCKRVNLRMSQCESGNRLGAVSEFGANSAEKLPCTGVLKNRSETEIVVPMGRNRFPTLPIVPPSTYNSAPA